MNQLNKKLSPSSSVIRMKILVTGATGFLGGWVLARLSEEFGLGSIVGTGRNTARAIELKNRGFTIITGDLTDPIFVIKEFSDITHVVHCAAMSSPWGDYKSFYENNVTATINILSGIPSIERFIYISTPSIYFDFSDRLNIKEDDQLPEKFVNHYAETKYLAEKEILNFPNPGMIRIIIRPRAIIGAGDTVILPRLIKAYKAGRLKIIGKGKNIADFSSVKNIAHAVYLSLIAEKSNDGKVFNITDDEPQLLWPLMIKTLDKLGLRSDLKRMNYSLAYLAATISEMYSKYFSKKEPILTRYGIGVLYYSLTLDISKAKKYLNYKPIISTNESIDEFINYYQTQLF